MPLKLKLNTGKGANNSQDSTPSTATPAASAAATTATPSSGGGLKLKLSVSQPRTPATEHAAATTAEPAAAKKSGVKIKTVGGAPSKKRAADDDTLSPAAKRLAKSNPTRKFSLKGPLAQFTTATDATTSPKLHLHHRRKSTQPNLRALNVKRPPPPRLPGHGYDSEDSEAETDPAIQQTFILRMEPGEDCDYIRSAIANGKIGLPASEGPAEVSLRFVEKDFRRAVVNVRGRKYAAVLVDLPCIVETMKSWDRRGWWKVADLNQMLLVLGRCETDDEAKTYPLPAKGGMLDEKTMQYAHGLTPPMRWVRKRRFRKRLSYKSVANVEEEVERLMKEDEAVEEAGGTVHLDFNDRENGRRSESYRQDEQGSESEAVETVEQGDTYQQDLYSDDAEGEVDMEEGEDGEVDIADLEDNLQAMFDEDHAAAAASTPQASVQDLLTDSPKPLADQAGSYAAVENAMQITDSPAAVSTPAGDTEASSASSDEDEDESSDEDAPDIVDEDALARAAERNQQLEEVADLERELNMQKTKIQNTKNQILKSKAEAQLKTLEQDLRVKRVAVFGNDHGQDEDGEGD